MSNWLKGRVRSLILNHQKFVMCTSRNPYPIAGMPMFIFFGFEFEFHLHHYDMLFGWIIRAECACNPVRYFAILSTQRSGSGWFETLLNSHINISSNGEIFSVKVRRSNISSITETLDKIYNLDWLSSASKNECTAAVGLKWMLNQVSTIDMVNLYHYFPSGKFKPFS